MEEVENGITGLAALDRASGQAQASVRDAERAFEIASERYKDGVDTYLDVLTAEQTLLTDRRQAVQFRGQRFSTAVYLIKALGGGSSLYASSASRDSSSSSRKFSSLLCPRRAYRSVRAATWRSIA